MDTSKPIGAAEFVKQSGVATPGYRASILVREMQKEYQATNNRFLRRDYTVGNFNVQLDFNGYRNWVKIDVWTAGFPDWVYPYFYGEGNREFDKRNTRRSNSISAENPAKVIASVNSLYRKSQDSVRLVLIIGGIRRDVEKLRDNGADPEILASWNQEAKDLGMFGEGGLLGMNVKQAKVLRAWFDGKCQAFAPKQEATAGQIVGALLDEAGSAEGFIDYLRTVHTLPPREKDFVYRDTTDPKTRHLRYGDEDTVFNVYAKRAARDGKIPYIGKIVVYHLENGTPAWSVVAIYGLNWPGEQIVDKQHPSRFEAAKVLWQFYASRMKLDKPVIP